MKRARSCVEHQRALSLNSSCAVALYFGAHIHAFNGNSAAVSYYAKRALRLSPFDTLSFDAHNALGLGAVQEARYDKAALHFANAVQANTRSAPSISCKPSRWRSPDA
ncbi:hypothetical protein V1289_001309 [Bradyrhizobium sp. AZCC 2289]